MLLIGMTDDNDDHDNGGGSGGDDGDNDDDDITKNWKQKQISIVNQKYIDQSSIYTLQYDRTSTQQCNSGYVSKSQH